ncbi:hypothetical protein ABEB36_009868 [Hypothenemus hampei]|uniref:VWFC domain-containing protein n=1 Tax=Hypothenemus hampei TaxID=57062 RepID=A0ABD1EKQ5_HYPHA
MKAWTQLLEPGPAILTSTLLLILAGSIQAAPASSEDNPEQSTEIEYYPVADATGCYYNFQHYDEGDRIITNEPCLNCTCHNRMLMCYLRVCPFTKAIGANCKVEKRADQCCPVITCPEVPVQLVTSTVPSTALGHLNEYGCSIDGLFYSDGARVPSNPDNPCELCYCIRNKTACVMQECTLNVEGCRPVFQEGVCCPVRYNCEHPDYLEGPTTPQITTTSSTTTTTTTEVPTTTQAPGVQCEFRGELYNDGELVKKDKPCEKCYCMRGDIVCAVQECGPTPLDKVNCTALPVQEGQCCPDTYDCAGVIEEELTTLSSVSYNTEPTTPISVAESEEKGTERILTTPGEEEQPVKISESVTTTQVPEEVTTSKIIEEVTRGPVEAAQPEVHVTEETSEETTKLPEAEGSTAIPESTPTSQDLDTRLGVTETTKEKEPVTIVTAIISGETPSVPVGEQAQTTEPSIESFTTRITEAVESITTRITEAIEAVTTSLTGSSTQRTKEGEIETETKQTTIKEEPTEIPIEEEVTKIAAVTEGAKQDTIVTLEQTTTGISLEKGQPATEPSITTETGKIEEEETEAPTRQTEIPEEQQTTEHKVKEEATTQPTVSSESGVKETEGLTTVSQQTVTEQPIVSEKCDEQGCSRIPSRESTAEGTTRGPEISLTPEFQTEAGPKVATVEPETVKPPVEPSTEGEEVVIVTEIPTKKTELPESMDHISETVKTTEAPKEITTLLEIQPTMSQEAVTQPTSEPEFGTTSKPSEPESGTTSKLSEPESGTTSRPSELESGTTSRHSEPESSTTSRPSESESGTTSRPSEPESGTTSRSSEAQTTPEIRVGTTEQPREEDNEIEHEDAGPIIKQPVTESKESTTTIISTQPEVVTQEQITEKAIVPEVCTSATECAPGAIPAETKPTEPTEPTKPTTQKISEEHTEETNEIPEIGTEGVRITESAQTEESSGEIPTEETPKEEEEEEEGSGQPATEEATKEPEITIPTTTRGPEITPTDIPSPETTELPEREIPGEGSCLVDGQTYKNNSNVPPINHCQASCKCVSSILRCESIECARPPAGSQNCLPIFSSPDSCCPIYSCAGLETTTTSIAIETEQPTTGAIIEAETSQPTEAETPVTTTITSLIEKAKPEAITPIIEEEITSRPITERISEELVTTPSGESALTEEAVVSTTVAAPTEEITTVSETKVPLEHLLTTKAEAELPEASTPPSTESPVPTVISTAPEETTIELRGGTEAHKEITPTTIPIEEEQATTVAISFSESPGEVTAVSETETTSGQPEIKEPLVTEPEITTEFVPPKEGIAQTPITPFEKEKPEEEPTVIKEGPETVTKVDKQPSKEDEEAYTTESIVEHVTIAEDEKVTVKPVESDSHVTAPETTETPYLIEGTTPSAEGDIVRLTEETKRPIEQETKQPTEESPLVPSATEKIAPEPSTEITRHTEEKTESQAPEQTTTEEPHRSTIEVENRPAEFETEIPTTLRGPVEEEEGITKILEPSTVRPSEGTEGAVEEEKTTIRTPEEEVTTSSTSSVSEETVPVTLSPVDKEHEEEQTVKTEQGTSTSLPEEVTSLLVHGEIETKTTIIPEEISTSQPLEETERPRISEHVTTTALPIEQTTIIEATEPIVTVSTEKSVEVVASTPITQEDKGETTTTIHEEVEISSEYHPVEEITSLPEHTTEIETQTPIAELPVKSEAPIEFAEATRPTEEAQTPEITTPSQEIANVSVPVRTGELFTSGTEEPEEGTTRRLVPGELSTSVPVSEQLTTILPAATTSTELPPSHIPGEEIPDYEQPGEDYDTEEPNAFGPGTCRYGGKVYVSAQQIPRDDPCDFCFCFRSDIICLQQSCPPPIPRCHEEPIRGFCCPRYECPVSMAFAVNVTTSTTTTTTTLPPHFLSHAYKGRASKTGCQISGRAYKVGEVIRSTSGPCLHCTCGGDGQMKCDPKACSPEPMLRQMISAAALRRRR